MSQIKWLGSDACRGGISWAPSAGSSLLTGLAHYWNLNEESGTRADAFGTSTLTDNNTVGFVTGINGNAANFIVANGEYLSVPAASNPWPTTGTSWTFSFWFKATVSGTGYMVIATFGTTGVQLYVTVAGTLNLIVGDGVGLRTLTSAAGALPVDGAAWHLVTCWWDSATQKHNIQVDGGAVATYSGTVAYTQMGGSSAIALWGTSGGANGINGGIDEASMYHRALTADERSSLYNSGAGKFYPTF